MIDTAWSHLLFLTCIVIVGLTPLSTAANEVSVFWGGTLIDGTGSDPVSNSVVIVENDRIASVGTTATTEIPADSKLIEIQGRTILPGLMNVHVHRGYDPENLKSWAHSGVTTVRDLAYSDSSVDWFRLRDELATDSANARLVAVGPMVTAPGGYPTAPFSIDAVTVRTPADAKLKTANLLERGADMIKMALEDGHYYEFFAGRLIPPLDKDRMQAIVEEAHRRGSKVTAHITNSALLPELLDTGVDDIAHMVQGDLQEEMIGELDARNIYWVPTLELWFYIQQHPLSVEANYRPFDQAIENLRKIVKAGGKVALGTDYAGIPDGPPFDIGVPAKEIAFMQDAGMTPMQIIVAATKNSAHVVNLGDSLGTVETGKIADLIVLDGDPLADTANLQNVIVVMRGGKIIRNDQ